MTTESILCEPISLTQHQLNTILKQTGSIFLDSSLLHHNYSNYSFIAFDPALSISIHHTQTSVTYRNGKQDILSSCPLTFLTSLLQRYHTDKAIPESPITGGLFGSFSYEFARYFADFSSIMPDSLFPDFIGGLYDKLIVINHQTNQQFYIHSTIIEKNLIPFSSYEDTTLDSFSASSISTLVSKNQYLDAVNQIKTYIYNGDIYQANYSVAFQTTFSGDPLSLYQTLSQTSPAPYCAYLNFDTYHIISSSPELFVSADHSQIMTRPIKGTIARGKTPADDLLNKEKLVQSQKDIAELTMITDLERHDLKKICQAGSIHVSDLRTIETYAHVFHGVSTISGTLQQHTNLSHLLEALFPGGSITGAPKIRAMEIIHELESRPRGPYTGCIGYVGFNTFSQFNIAIRTAYTMDNQLYFHAGGGIVSDSIPEDEWNEVNVKSKGLFQALTHNQACAV